MPQEERKTASALMTAYLARRGDLVRAFSPRLGSRDAAEELVQDVGRRIAELDPRDDLASPEAYLYRLAWNVMLDGRRYDRRARDRDDAWRRESVATLAGEALAETPLPEDAFDARRRLQRLLAELETLPPAVRRAFRLHKLDGHTHAETARLMGISRSGVEKHMMTALRLLTERLR